MVTVDGVARAAIVIPAARTWEDVQAHFQTDAHCLAMLRQRGFLPADTCSDVDWALVEKVFAGLGPVAQAARALGCSARSAANLVKFGILDHVVIAGRVMLPLENPTLFLSANWEQLCRPLSEIADVCGVESAAEMIAIFDGPDLVTEAYFAKPSSIAETVNFFVARMAGGLDQDVWPASLPVVYRTPFSAEAEL